MSYVRAVNDRYDLEAISVWLEGALPPVLVSPPDPRAYIAELEAEVAFARHAYLETLADRLRELLAECRATYPGEDR